MRFASYTTLAYPAQTPIGWWSWTAYYGAINEGETLANADWQAAHLKALGYKFFQVDEGYQYARGEYVTANATQFPNGMRAVGYHVTGDGLTFGVWTAPFQVTSRAWVYEHHKDWLVHNAKGEPIHTRATLASEIRLDLRARYHQSRRPGILAPDLQDARS